MKKHIVRLLALCLPVLLAFAAGCGGGRKGGGGGSGDFSGQSLLISARLSGYGEWMSDIAEEFEMETGCDIEINWDPTLNGGVRNIFLSESYVLDDLYFANVSDLWYQWAKEGKIQPISGFEDRLRSEVAAYGTYEDNRYTLDPLFPSIGFAYNQDYLNEIPTYKTYTQGEFPETFQGLLDLCEKINSMPSIGGRSGVKPMSWGGKVDDLDHIFRALWAQGNGGEDWVNFLSQSGRTPDESLFKSQSLKNALTAMSKLIDSDGDYSRNSILGCGEKTNIQQQQNFLNGDCVFCPTGGYFPAEMKDSITPNTFDYRFANIPLYDTTETVRTSLIPVPCEAFFIPHTTTEETTELALAFLQYLFTEENCVRLNKEVGTALSFRYEFTEEDYAELTPFQQQATRIVHETKAVLRGVNAPLHLAGYIGSGFLNAKGDSILLFSEKMLKNEAGYTIDDIDTIMDEHFKGMSKTWDDRLRRAGLL